MTVCANRPEPVGFFNPCNPCKCAEQVKADIIRDQLVAAAEHELRRKDTVA